MNGMDEMKEDRRTLLQLAHPSLPLGNECEKVRMPVPHQPPICGITSSNGYHPNQRAARTSQ